MILACKLIEDRNLWNIDIVYNLNIFDLKYTNKFEHLFLNLLDFKMYVKPCLFEEYFKWLQLYKEFTDQELNEENNLSSQKMNVDA